MDHDYSLPSAALSVAGALRATRKRTGRANDPRRLWDKKRAKTRVNIGVAFPRWRELRDKLGLQRDADLACVLLDSYQKGGPSASTPSKRPRMPVRRLSAMAPSRSFSKMSVDLQNTVIDWKDPDDDDTWETASEDSTSDEDYIPSICLRYVPLATRYVRGTRSPHSDTECRQGT
ncbi:uncharacterized protein si:ch211-40k21.5 [Xiphias gladius]|uniref:uncharacterized protein si:ch211-40k21.5 n=1 Tax=Xiphias gladius TaxID=8245 RepID=UPI001A995948|nr:uncharacterized protein si:ch211-40k21.5 [Xiphias gladius]